MSEQRTPEEEYVLQLHTENVSIVEKLLGWKRAGDPDVPIWLKPATETRREEQWYTPSFTTWAEAGLIIDALQSVVGWEPARARSQLGWLLKTSELTPLAIRAAALEYIGRQE